MDRREAIVRRGERRRGFVPYWLRTMAEVDVDFLEAYERIYELTAVRKGKLPPKVREMIVVAAVSIGGYLPGIKDHVRRALRLGATKEELVEAARRPLAEVIGFPRTMTYFCRRSAAEGLASWYADEAQLPEAHGATALALRKFYGLDDETIEYFLEHVRADLGHTGALTLVHGMVALIDVLKELEDEKKPAARAAKRAVRGPAKRRAGR